MMAKDSKQEERNAFDELKRRMKEVVGNELYEENLFYRFLKGQGFNVDKAEKLLKQHLEMRKKYDVKNISTFKHPEVLEKYFPIIKLGHDKEGSVVRYIPSGKIDWIGLNSSCKLEDMTKHLIHSVEDDLEEMKSQSKKLDTTETKIVYICNLQDFPFAQATNKKAVYNYIFLANFYQNNYPEVLKAVHVINASVFFYIVFSVIQKFVQRSIIKKIKVHSDDSWKDDLLKTIDAGVLPAFLGGNKTDPDGNPLCLTFINHGKSVPEKYYIHRSKRSLADLPDVQQQTIPRASFHKVFLEVKVPDSFLEWEFETKSRDIGFGIFYQKNEGEKIESIPIQRINTDEYAETGIHHCKDVGTYIVVFDNTYSLLRTKHIFYKIKIMSPQEEKSHLKN